MKKKTKVDKRKLLCQVCGKKLLKNVDILYYCENCKTDHYFDFQTKNFEILKIGEEEEKENEGN